MTFKESQHCPVSISRRLRNPVYLSYRVTHYCRSNPTDPIDMSVAMDPSPNFGVLHSNQLALFGTDLYRFIGQPRQLLQDV